MAHEPSGFTLLSGNCTVLAKAGASCVMSPNYPYPYPALHTCSLAVPPTPLRVVDFDTERGFDFVYVNGEGYSGSGGSSLYGVTPLDGQIEFTSDGSVEATGFHLCVDLWDAPPSSPAPQPTPPPPMPPPRSPSPSLPPPAPPLKPPQSPPPCPPPATPPTHVAVLLPSRTGFSKVNQRP